MAISIPHKIITSSLPGRLDEVRGKAHSSLTALSFQAVFSPSEKDLFAVILCKIHLVTTEQPL